jgi:hypothetical protein
MHLVYLGVVRKILNVWCKGILPHRLSPREISGISDRLILFRKYLPSEFSRKSRSLSELANWKAVELRAFILYLAPAALIGILDNSKYRHILKLQCAILILSRATTEDYEKIEFANSLLNDFVQKIQTLYYNELLSYNMHSLTHLADDVYTFGPLDMFSAFQFENHMQTFKRSLRKKNCHLAQIVNRIAEVDNNEFTHSGHMTRLKNDIGRSFCYVNNLKVSCHLRDSCFLYKETVILVDSLEYTNEIVFVKFRHYTRLEKLRFFPTDSREFSIYIVNNLSYSLDCIPVDELVTKCVRLPFRGDRYLCIPMITRSY